MSNDVAFLKNCARFIGLMSIVYIMYTTVAYSEGVNWAIPPWPKKPCSHDNMKNKKAWCSLLCVSISSQTRHAISRFLYEILNIFNAQRTRSCKLFHMDLRFSRAVAIISTLNPYGVVSNNLFSLFAQSVCLWIVPVISVHHSTT